MKANDTFGKGLKVGFTSFGIGEVKGKLLSVSFVGEEVSGGAYLKDSEKAAGSVHVSGLTPVVRRKVTAQPASNAQYSKVLGEFLRSKGLTKAKPRIMHLWRVDLDGDGVDEVLIEARSRDEENVGRQWGDGDYSVVLLRTVRGGKAVNVPLEFISWKLDKSMELKQLRGIADINGDQGMEIVTGGEGYEWENAALWRFARGQATKLLENGAGV